MKRLSVSKKLAADGRPQYKINNKISWTVPGDIHLPFQDKRALQHITDNPFGTSGLFITGDLLDYYWLSSWPKLADKTKQAGYTATRENLKDFVSAVSNNYDYVAFGSGNHELRLETLTRKFPGFDGKWYWIVADLLPTTWTFFDHGYRCELSQKTTNGLPILLEHGDRALYGGVPSAERLVNAYPGQCTIIGHNHRLQHHYKTTWKNGRSTTSMAYTVGHLSDIRKNNYAANPNWQQGYATISEDGFIQINHLIGGRMI